MKKKKVLVIVICTLICVTFFSCKKLGNKIVSKVVEKEVIEESTKKGAREIIEQTSKKGVKELAEEGAEKASKKIMKDFISSNSAIKQLYENFEKYISKDFADGIVVKTTKQGTELISKDFPSSAIRINGNTVYGKAGSLVDNGPVNEFLNHLLPKKTYIIDDLFIYQTDEYGRVVSCYANRTKAYQILKGKRNPQRNSNVQKIIIEKLDGRAGFDDGGHLFANTTGGPNELINQVPMAKTLNRNGKWRELERLEENALKGKKTVTSSRKLLYHGSEKRPYAIEFITKIDGKETKVIIDNVD